MKFLIKLVSKKYRSLRFRLTRKVYQILWPNDIFNYPFKMRRYPEFAEHYLREKGLFEESNPRKKLSLNSYRELIVDKDSETVVKQVISYYNTSLIRSRFCPTTVTTEDMEYMIKNAAQPHRHRRHLDYLFIKGFDIWRNSRLEQNLKQIKREKEKRLKDQIRVIGCFDSQNNLQYGIWRNSLFTRHFEKSLKKHSFNNLKIATLFGQKLVIDCSFDKQMQEYETQSVGRQMARIYQINRMQSPEPFDLHFCSCDSNSRVMQNFSKYLNPIKEFERNYVNIHSESYSQLFPNRRLIYLSPDARDLMEEFDHNAIYILGSLVGKTCRLPLTRDKALSEGIECYRLPIHRYVELNPLVKKTLSFQSCFKILLEMKDHNDWGLAFIRGIQEHKLKDKIGDQL